MDEGDVQRILSFPPTMIGSDGLPHDERPHPRLWGTFPRVLGHYSRDLGLFPLETAVWKMTGLTAAVRPGRTRPGPARLLRRSDGVRSGLHRRRRLVRAPHRTRRRHPFGVRQRRAGLARACLHRPASAACWAGARGVDEGRRLSTGGGPRRPDPATLQSAYTRQGLRARPPQEPDTPNRPWQLPNPLPRHRRQGRNGRPPARRAQGPEDDPAGAVARLGHRGVHAVQGRTRPDRAQLRESSPPWRARCAST